MKIRTVFLCCHLVSTGLLPLTAWAGSLPAQLPEFQSKDQLARNRVEASARAQKSSEVFFTGKAFETGSGSYLFKYRSYSPEQARWNSQDPSGFPDGANNLAYIGNSPVAAYDFQGLVKKVLWLVGLPGNSSGDQWSWNEIQSAQETFRQELVDLDNNLLQGQKPTHYLDDGDWFDFNSISSPSQIASFSIYDKIYIAAHGDESSPGVYTGDWGINGQAYATSVFTAYSNVQMIYGCNPTDGLINTATLVAQFKTPTENYLYE